MNRREASLVAVAAVAYGIVFSWRLHFREAHTSVEWLFFRTVDQFRPPDVIPAQLKTVSQWGLESRPLSPWRVLYWLWGRDAGMNLELPIHLAIAFAGGWVLARVLGMGCLAALTCAAIWPSSSWVYLHFEAGHLVFLPFGYLPWMFAALLTDLWWAVGGLMALTFLEGGAWPMFYMSISLGVLAMARSATTHSLRPLAILAAATVLTVILSLPKFAYIPDVGGGLLIRDGNEHISGMDYLSALFSRNQTQFRWATWDDVGSMAWWEVGAYVSPFFVPLIVIGATPGWALAALAALALSLGNYFGAWSPYCLFHVLPIVSWTWMATHWFIVMTFCFGVMAAHGVERLSRTRTGMVIGGLLLAGGLADAWIVSTAGLGLIK